MAETYASELREHGWTHVDFGIDERERARYAQLANRVITMAGEDGVIAEALNVDLLAGTEAGAVRTGTLGIGTSRNSADKKIYLHAGFQSRSHAGSVLPEYRQPQELRAFWEANTGMLAEVERSMKIVLQDLGATALKDAIFTTDTTRRNIALRTVRYIDALQGSPGEEVVSGHADLGALTEHLYETHGGWFKGVAYPPELISDRDTPEHRAAIREMRGNLQFIDNRSGEAIFFLGANWHTLPDRLLPEEFRDLPACYHAGFRPEAAGEEVSPYAEAVTGNAPDRVSVVVFAHPNVELQKNGSYVPATVPQCRPQYVA